MKKILWYVDDFLTNMNKHHIGMYSAATAYFIFICVIPFLTILLYLIPYTPIEEVDVISMISNVLPSYAYDFTINIIDEVYSKTAAVLPLSLLIMFWTASKAMVSIRNGLNDINDYFEKKNYFLVRLIGTLDTAVAIVVIIFISLLSLFGETLHDYLSDFNIKFINVLSVLVNYKMLITLIGFFIAFMILYAYLPAKKNKIREVIPGAIFSTIVCQLFSKVFNYLVNNYLSFSMYGSLATIVVLMMYFNFFFYFFFIGAYLNKYLVKGSI